MKLPKSSYNWITLIGAIIATISLVLIAILFIITSISDTSDSYMGLFIYIALPVFMVLGLFIIPIGMLFKMRRLRKTVDDTPKWPSLNLNDPRHRNAFLIFSVATVVILFLTSIGSYEAFHYTESTEFCGTLCHKVMEPEYVAYQNSPHANVACVECHVGSGADWYVKSKLSGMYQIYSVLFEKYPRPIETPLHDLRPARETCQKCHWPQKFYARQLRYQKNFLADSSNTEWDITLQMKIGSSYSALGASEGIHWHINKNVKIEYISEDASREIIPWVKYTNLDTGEEIVYQDEDAPLADSLKANSSTRTMDCIDCHNRPSHTYKSAPDYIDNALLSGEIPKEVPSIKSAAMTVLASEFTNKDTALMMINDQIHDYYKGEFPDYYKNNIALINKAIEGIQKNYSKNEFPFMKVKSTAYPNHIGHHESNGCFRCHSDRHKAKSGKTISKDCNLCHTIIGQGPVDRFETVPFTDTLEFKHPEDIGEEWKEMNCADCHAALY